VRSTITVPRMGYRIYCRAATVVFVLFTAYPLVGKVMEDRLAHDWAHSALHLVSACAGAYAGWIATSTTPAKLYTWAVGVGYLILGIVGWFIDGLLLSTHLAIPLGPVENVFHLALSLSALLVVSLAARRPVPEQG
jgi:hypothetical protein